MKNSFSFSSSFYKHIKSLKLLMQSGADTTDAQIKQVVELWRRDGASIEFKIFQDSLSSEKK